VPLDSTVIYLGAAQYGRLATVIAHRTKTRTIDIRLASAQEHAQLGHHLLASVASDVYYSTSDAARRVGLSPSQLSRLTGLLHVLCEKPSRDGSTRTERVNIGLSFKMHSKMLKVRVGGPDAVRDAVGHHLSPLVAINQFLFVFLQAQGYARYRKESWEYSAKALAVLEAYRKAFPKLFSRISAMGNNVNEYYEDDLFDANDAPDHGV